MASARHHVNPHVRLLVQLETRLVRTNNLDSTRAMEG